MASEPISRTASVTPIADNRRALVERIASSVPFQKSNRLRELLLFVAEHSLTNPDAPLREHEIGVGVFGRPENYDTSQDTLVRVQASQLRKKLQQYFEEEGRDEVLLVEMPKGGYSLSFHSRDPVAEPVALPAAAPNSRFYAAAGIAAFLLIVCALLLFQNTALRRRAEFGLGSKPTVDAFWRQMFGNGQRAYLILADANLVVFEDVLKQHISLPDYQNKAFQRLAERIADPGVRAIALNVVNRNYTSMADAGILRRMDLIFASNELPFDVLSARDATLGQITAQNTILMGSRRANPWVTVYEDKLNFQTVFEETPRAAYFLNKSPKAGEPAEYRGIWSKRGFCRVAFMGNTKGSGNVMLISGTDIPSTEAGGEFITSENSMRRLRESFGLSSGQPTPHFEVLLETKLLNNTVAQFEIVATRRK